MRTETHLADIPNRSTQILAAEVTRKEKAKTPKPLKPKIPDDWAICRGEKASAQKGAQIRQLACPWSEVRNRRGRKKSISTPG